MGVLRRERVEWKTPDQVRLMRQAGLVVADALAAVRAEVRPGTTTAQLDAVAEDLIRGAGALPSFLGYQGFPASLCVSVNDEVVHGIPGERVLEDGDLVSVDCGAVLEGWHGDAAFSVVVDGGSGAVDPADVALVEATEAAMWAGVAALATAGRLGEVGAAVEDSLVGRFGVVEGYVGHGIGTAMHQPPEVLNHRSRERGAKVRPGLCVAVEPMVTRGEPDTDVLADDWTVVTTDGSRAAHWEHTVAVLEGGLWVLTAHDGGAAGLARHGLAPAALG
ncbi:type I methionyl aminopeptidase [Pseudokineococcus sp. 1T1Z-3]|uniref:type I methionyl aminopeptidase n=1 Tax=Pseudokineococcus sp. 1T1Z-3 TaxID=3132745 RepID=UPI0030AEFE79